MYHLLNQPLVKRCVVSITLSRPLSPLLQAAQAFAAFSLNSPSKPPSKEYLLDDKKLSVSPKTLGDESDSEEDDFSVLRTKFVGEVDLPECKLLSLYHPTLLNSSHRRRTPLERI